MAEQRIEVKHRTAKGAERLTKLTSAAADLFLERGFESVAIDDLISRVGGSRRNVYSHFGGKEGLFAEVVTVLCDELAMPLAQLKLEETDAGDALRIFGRQLLETVLHPRALALHRLMIAEGVRFPQLAQATFNAGHARAAATLAEWMTARFHGIEHGKAPLMSAIQMAQMFVQMVVADAQLRALVGLDVQPLPSAEVDRIVGNAVETFLHGVGC